MKKFLFGVMIVAVMCIGSVGVSYAATASWNANTESDLAGTRIYRAPGPCTNPGAFTLVDTELKPSTSTVLPNPSTDGVYCHRATHFDTAGNESLFSSVVEFNYNVLPPQAPQGFNVAP